MSRLQTQIQPPRQRKRVKGMPEFGPAVPDWYRQQSAGPSLPQVSGYTRTTTGMPQLPTAGDVFGGINTALASIGRTAKGMADTDASQWLYRNVADPALRAMGTAAPQIGNAITQGAQAAKNAVVNQPMAFTTSPGGSNPNFIPIPERQRGPYIPSSDNTVPQTGPYVPIQSQSVPQPLNQYGTLLRTNDGTYTARLQPNGQYNVYDTNGNSYGMATRSELNSLVPNSTWAVVADATPNQYTTPAGPPVPSGYAMPSSSAGSFTEGVLNAGLEQMRRQEALIQATPANRLQRPDPYAMGIRQGNYDVAQASATGIPQGGMTYDQTRDAYLTDQRIKAALDAQEAQRGMLGPGPSGIDWKPRDAAARGNMDQGTPWQPVPGTVGLPAFVPQAELDRQIYDARRKDEAQKYKDFTANMDPNASYAAAMGGGKPRKSYESTQAYQKMKERAAATRPQREAKRLNQRAAVFARAHGLPMNTALLQLTAMDEQARAAAEDRQANLSRDQRAANPAMLAGMTAEDQMAIARQNALSNAVAGLWNYGGTLTPELIGAATRPFEAPATGLPNTRPTSSAVTPPEEIERRRLAAVQSGNNRQAQLEVDRANALNEIATRDDIPLTTREAVAGAAQNGDWNAVSRLLEDSIGIEAFDYMNRLMASDLYSPNNPAGSSVADEALASPNANFLQSLLYHLGRMGTSGAPMMR